MGGVRGEREVCGPSKFSIPRISLNKLQLELLFSNVYFYSIEVLSALMTLYHFRCCIANIK